ncbi:MAG: hypothetical protein M3430_10700 [Acidobacteriota bacterium]|nr:hypothetical protein [Acidobacteriota bacterium]
MRLICLVIFMLVVPDAFGRSTTWMSDATGAPITYEVFTLVSKQFAEQFAR